MTGAVRRLAAPRVRLPLGAGALATSTLGLDPVATAERLGLDRAFDNSLDAVSDRDVLQECVAVAAICATHLSRLAADLLRWTDPRSDGRSWTTPTRPVRA